MHFNQTIGQHVTAGGDFHIDRSTAKHIVGDWNCKSTADDKISLKMLVWSCRPEYSWMNNILLQFIDFQHNFNFVYSLVQKRVYDRSMIIIYFTNSIQLGLEIDFLRAYHTIMIENH